MTDTYARLQELSIPTGIATDVLNTLDPEHRDLARSRKHIRDHVPLIVLTGDSKTRKAIAARLATEAKTRGKRITALVPCDETDTSANCSVLGYCFCEVDCEIGSRPVIGKWLHSPSTFDNIIQPSFWKELEKLEFLILDDLGLEPPTPTVRSRIAGLLVTRYDADRPTIVTTNLAYRAFADTYGSGPGARIMGRLGNSWVQVAQ